MEKTAKPHTQTPLAVSVCEIISPWLCSFLSTNVCIPPPSLSPPSLLFVYSNRWNIIITYPRSISTLSVGMNQAHAPPTSSLYMAGKDHVEFQHPSRTAYLNSHTEPKGIMTPFPHWLWEWGFFLLQVKLKLSEKKGKQLCLDWSGLLPIRIFNYKCQRSECDIQTSSQVQDLARKAATYITEPCHI